MSLNYSLAVEDNFVSAFSSVFSSVFQVGLLNCSGRKGKEKIEFLYFSPGLATGLVFNLIEGVGRCESK